MGTPTKYYSSTFVANHVGTPGGINNSATALYALVTPAGVPGGFPYELVLDEGTASEELVLVTAGAGTVGSPWTITRNHDGTSAHSHSQTTGTINHPFCADDLTQARLHESLDNTTGAQPHGLPLAAWSAGSFAKIQDVTLSNSTTAIITWSSIPGTYGHLLVVAYGRLTSGSAQDGSVSVTFNGDSTNKYQTFNIGTSTETGSQVGPSNANAFSQSSLANFIVLAANQAGSSVNAGGGFMLIPNYAGTTLNKMAIGISGYGNGTSIAGLLQVRSGHYNPGSQVAITSMSLAASIGNFLSGTRLALYGLG